MYGVKDKVPEILLYLTSIGLKPGVPITVKQKAPLGGPITIEVAGVAHAISIELARTLLVLSPVESPAS